MKTRTIILTIIAGVTSGVHAQILTSEANISYEQRCQSEKAIKDASNEITKLSGDEAECMKFLYAYMPLPDVTNRSTEFYLTNAVRPALTARKQMPWGNKISDDIFKHFVLPLRVNNEPLDNHRPLFYEELRDRIDTMSMYDAILEINHWCHEKVSYQPSDGRTHSPLQSVSSAIGRCGEESTFTVAAMRSMGIPARQVYTPRWAHTDDNHAWVEVWCDGQWHFLGACEPEPVLNLGWFNEPARRGMLMHARVFGDYRGAGEILARQEGNTDLNVTANYAATDTLNVIAVDKNGREVEGATVSFRLYNYAELYPIATKKADKYGRTSLIAGKGDLVVWATDGTKFGIKKATIGSDKAITVPLEYDAGMTSEFELNLIPPVASKSQICVSEAQRGHNNIRMQKEDSIRNAYIESWPDTNQWDSEIGQLIMKSRGNYKTIIEVLDGTNDVKTINLLKFVTDKDLTDIQPDIIKAHLIAENQCYDDEVFNQYVMSPRIEHEELTAFRNAFEQYFSKKQKNTFIKDPTKWVQWVIDSIAADHEWYPEQLTMHPAAVLKYKHTSTKSRDIFYVAGARSLGIAARLNPISGKTQWADKNSDWHDVSFEQSKYEVKNTGHLQLDYNSTGIVQDPKYYSHFTVSKIENGEPKLLTYPDFIPWSSTFKEGENLEQGQYLIVTGQRLADGGVLSKISIITLADSLHTSLVLRNDTTRIQVIDSFDSENRYQPNNSEDMQSILSTTGRGYYVLGLISNEHEPSTHALRDIAAEKDLFEQIGSPIVIVYESTSKCEYNQNMPTLPACVSMGYDKSGEIAQDLITNGDGRGNYPIFIIADTFNRVVYKSSGYNIGLGQRLADVLRRLAQ